MNTQFDRLSPMLRSVIEAAVAAPSPDNNQPWKFKPSNESLRIFLDRERALPSDEASLFDMTALGAAVENATVAATQHDRCTQVTWLGLQGSDETSVELSFKPGCQPDPLAQHIYERCTCRKHYDAAPIASDILGQLDSSIRQFPGATIEWLTSREDKTAFGKLIAKTDSMRFRTKPFHAELYRQLRFERDDVDTTRDGLDSRTLELPFGVTSMLRLLGNWRIMQAVHSFRLTSLLTMPSKVAAIKSGAIGVISVGDSRAETFMTGGRAIERAWLKAAELGLGMHPMGSLPIFLLQEEPRAEFKPIIQQVRQALSSLMPRSASRVIQLAFRVGFAEPPTARSLRRTPEAMLIPN